MKKQIILVFAALLGGLGLNTVRADIPADAVRGVFSVGAESKVVFAHGNLQYTAKNSTWSFATHQYDIIGADNSKIGKNTYGGAIDLFGWGTGLNPIQYSCASCATSFPMAGNDPENNGTWDAAGRRNAPMDGEYTEFKDWGENLSGTWRTLTAEEWNYLFFSRDLDLFGLGNVDGVNGLILLPDNWENNPPSLEFTSAIDAGLIAYEEGYYSFTGNGYSLTTNNYTAIQWQSMEDNGAVFLPAAGSRAGQECSNIGEYGYYWSSTPEEEGTAYSLGFTESLVAPMVGEPRASGQAVRLVSPYVEEDEDEPATEINANFKFHPFTVNGDGGQVSFSQGNLQYQPQPEKAFRFAAKQNEYIGEGNHNTSCMYEGWIDLYNFGLGKNPTMVCGNCFEQCGQMDEDDEFDSPTRRNTPMGENVPPFEEFGTANNPIANGGNDTWRTMTADEWEYLFTGRENANGLFGFGKVDGVNGMIVLPDDWDFSLEFVPAAGKMTLSDGIYTSTNTETVYSHNTYSNQSWQQMEAAGAVFLPAAGMRSGNNDKECSDLEAAGYYMSSTEDVNNSADNVFILRFDNAVFRPKFSTPWEAGHSVRLVKEYTEEEEEELALTIEVDPDGSGYVADENDEEIWAVDMVANETMMLTAVANDGYVFDKWDVIGGEISDPKDNPVTFTMGSGDATLTAHFIPEEPEPETYTLIIQTTEGGIVKENEEQITYAYMAEGDTKTLTAEPAEGYQFAGWEVTEGGIISSETSATITFTMGTSETTLTANFEPITVTPENHTLTIVVNPSEGGVVKAGNDEFTGSEMAVGDQITLTAENAEGYEFAGWEITVGGVTSPYDGGSGITFTMGTEDVTLTAIFGKLYQLTIAVTPEEGDNKVVLVGTSYTIDHYDHLMIAKGTELDLEAQEDANYVFIGWELTIGETTSIIGTDHTLHYTMGEEVTVILAKYERLYTLNVSVTEGGVVKENEVDMAKSSYKMKKDDTQTLIAKAATDYNFAGWDITVGGVTSAYSADAEITFTMGEEDVTLTANFNVVAHVHTWGTPTYSWNSDYTQCTATRECLDDATHTETETVNSEIATVAPTCESAGSETYTATFVNEAFKTQTQVNTIMPLGHDWKAPVYEWSNDHMTCTATRVCNRDASHVETETVSATVTIEGTTTKVYTAQFENSAFETQIYNEYFYTLTVNVNIAEGGIVKENADNTAAASYTMKENDTQTLIAEAATNYDFIGWDINVGGITSAYSTSLSITFTMGTEDVILTANFREKTHEHTWGEITYTWNGDYSQCTATRTCTEDASHVETETVNSTSVTAEPTCDVPGSKTFKATFVNPDFRAQEKAIIIEPLGHDWQAAVYTWSEDHTTCTATLPCGRDHDHDIVETVTAVPSTSGSTTVYTATFTNPAFETQTYSFTPSIKVTMSQYGFLSLYADKAYTVPADLNAIIYTGIDGKNLTYQKLTVIPAYTGVVLYAKANTTYMLYETVTTESYPTNMLHGTLTDTPIDNGNVHYILTYNEEKGLAGLFWPMGTNRGVGSFINRAGKAYLEIPSGMNVAPRFFTMRGEACEEGTAVDETQADGDGKYYDILGREVAEPQPQQIYIHNGQKVLYGK